MKPPLQDGESVTDAAVAVTDTPPSSSEAAQVLAQTSAALVVSETPEMSPAESEDEEADEMVEALEELILEAYNNMQIDGEYIFLPDEVAEKLHRVAEQMKMESGEETQIENLPSAGEDSSSGDAATSKTEVEEMKVQQETPEDRPEPEQEQEQQLENVDITEKKMRPVLEQQTSEEGEARLRKVQTLQAEAAEIRDEKQKRRIPRVASTENLFTELEPVPEIDESASSGPPSPSPPHSRSHSGVNTPKPRAHAPAKGHGTFPPPPIISLSSTPSSAAASPDQAGKPSTRTPDQSGSSTRKSKALTYEKRREAALKLKEDKKKRELRIRESARKMRENSKRQLEEAHQREMEEKRERVRRIRQERLHRRAGNAIGSKEAKKNG